MQDRLFRALVRLLPDEFRAGYAREIEATFRAERLGAGSGGGRMRLARLWLATVGDLLRAAPAEHFDILARDIRFALRTMLARPVHTLTAVVTLALGLGANVAMFAVIDAVLLAPLPYGDPETLVTIEQTEHGANPRNFGYQTFVDLQQRSRSFEGLVAVGAATATLTGDGLDAERVNAMRVSRGYFGMLGVTPAFGRPFTDDEDRPGAARRVVILSDSLWRRRFAADPGAVGRVIDIGGIDHRIVGVLPRGFDDLVAARMYQGAELWYPLGYEVGAPYACRSCRHLRVFGRLAPGSDAGAAAVELNRIVADLERDHPTDYRGAGAQVTRLADVFLGPVKPVLLVLWAGVGVLLLVACGNVANLLLLGASERSQEVAVRAALGVTRGRLTRQLFTESALLGSAGGLAGLLPAWAAVRVLAVTGPEQIPRLAEAAIDGRAVAVALSLTTACSVLFGLVPLRELRRRSPSAGVFGGGRRTASTATWRVRSSLVAANVAMASLLCAG
ncbi:MAG: ABC transporter permease [Acidobacteriota bacterium]